MKQSIRIGTGSGWWGDRISPAAELAKHGQLDYLCFETMAEATISAAQVRATIQTLRATTRIWKID